MSKQRNGTVGQTANRKKLTRQLIAICSKCNQPVSARDAENTSLTRLGRLIRRANRSGFEVQLVDDPPESKCSCPANETPASKWSQFSIRQILFVMTILGLLLAVFRHPLGQMLDESVWKSAVAPWTVVGNLFLGTAIIDPRPHFEKSAMAAVAFTVSTPLAVLTVFFALQGALMWIYRMWLEVSDD